MANRSEQFRPSRCVVLCGNLHLAFFRISLPIVQVGGGIVLVAMGWAILLQRDEGCDAANRKNFHPQDAVRQAYLLTLPLTVGPISVAITLDAKAAHSYALHPLTILAAFVGSALIALSIFLCYGFSDRLARVLGPTGMSVIQVRDLMKLRGAAASAASASTT